MTRAQRRLAARTAAVAVGLAGTLGAAQASAATQIITTIAGNGGGDYTGDGGPATSAETAVPVGIAVKTDGTILLANADRNVIRKINPAGVISPFAGIPGSSGFSGDGGAATGAQLAFPYNVAVGLDGATVYIADSDNHRIRKVVPAGTITTIAGTGPFSTTGDGGPATSATMTRPRGMAVMADGSLLFAEQDANSIRRIGPSGTMSRFAGSASGSAGVSGDGGPATSALLNTPMDVAVGADDSVYIADRLNCRIRKVTAGVITTLAGTGTGGGGCNPTGATGPAASAILGEQVSVDVAPDGSVVFPDEKWIRRVSGGTITNIAGNGTYGFSGDGGPALSAQLSGNLQGLAVTSSGAVIFSDIGSRRVRKVDAGLVPGNPNPSTGTTSPVSTDATATATVGPYLALSGGSVNYGTIVPTILGSTYPATSSLSVSTSSPTGVTVTVTASGSALGIPGATQTVTPSGGSAAAVGTSAPVVTATQPVNQAFTSSWLLSVPAATVLTRGATPTQVLTYTATGSL